jgi:hypothetical protein
MERRLERMERVSWRVIYVGEDKDNRVVAGW